MNHIVHIEKRRNPLLPWPIQHEASAYSVAQDFSPLPPSLDNLHQNVSDFDVINLLQQRAVDKQLIADMQITILSQKADIDQLTASLENEKIRTDANKKAS